MSDNAKITSATTANPTTHSQRLSSTSILKTRNDGIDLMLLMPSADPSHAVFLAMMRMISPKPRVTIAR